MANINIVSVKKRGDDVTVTGTVDGIDVQSHLWFSALQQLPDTQSRKMAIAKSLKDALPPVDTDLTTTYQGQVTI